LSKKVYNSPPKNSPAQASGAAEGGDEREEFRRARESKFSVWIFPEKSSDFVQSAEHS